MSDSKIPQLWSSMSPEQYLANRVDDQLAWYSKKSTANKNWFYRLQLITLIASALIPVVSLSSSEFGVRLLVAIIGSIAAVATGIVALCQFRDLWTDYRTTAERLKHEKYLFLTGSEPYDEPDCFALFVNRIESTILKENTNWQEKVSTQKVKSVSTKKNTNPGS